MNHLTDEQLSALLDDALAPRERAEADAHLAGCDRCRAQLAELSTLDESLGSALAHDPGEAYFESFADRVAARIAPSGAGPAPARAPGRGLRGWLLSPRGLSLVGGTAALLLAAGIAWQRFQRDDDVARTLPRTESPVGARLRELPPAAGEERAPAAPSPAAPSPAAAGSAPARGASAPAASAPPALKSAPGANELAPSPQAQRIQVERPAVAPTVADSARAREQRGTAWGGTKSLFRAGPSPAPTLQESATAPATRALASKDEAQALSTPAAGEPSEGQPPARVCGVVRDTRGTPIGGAQVTLLGARARTTRSAPDGTFCLEGAAEGDSVSVLRLGFAPLRLALSRASALAIALEPVGTLGPGAGLLLGAKEQASLGGPGFSERAAGVSDMYQGQSTAARRALAAAREADQVARRDRTAPAWEQAAGRWATVASAATGRAALDARFREVNALREAFRREPTPARRASLTAALDAFLASAPARLPERATAVRWRSEL